jgi:hypothetical protein
MGERLETLTSLISHAAANQEAQQLNAISIKLTCSSNNNEG